MYMHEIRARTWDIYVRKVTKGLSLSFSLSTTFGESRVGKKGEASVGSIEFR